LRRIEPSQPKQHFKTKEELPAPQPAQAGTIKLVPFPSENEQQTSPIVFGWPAHLHLSHLDYTMAGLFIRNVAGDPTTNLYKKLIDTKTREINVGAQGIFGNVSDEQGNPFYIWVVELPPSNITETTIKDLRARIVAEMARIASWKDGSPELKE